MSTHTRAIVGSRGQTLTPGGSRQSGTGFLCLTGDGVAIDARDDGWVVAEDLGHHWDGRPVSEKQGRSRVPRVMEADAAQPGRLVQVVEALRDGSENG